MDIFFKRMIMTLLVCCSISASYALTFTVDNITYETLSDNTVKVTGFTFSLKEVVIPSTVEYQNVVYQVKEIGDKGLYGYISNAYPTSQMTSLVISEGVEKIGEMGVARNDLLETVCFPSSLVEIGDKAFCNLKGLREYTIPETNNLTKIGAEAFSSCPKLFKGEPLLLPANISEIGARAFQYNNFTSVVIPINVKNINEGLFNFCSLLTSATLHDGITRIERSAFNECKQLQFLDYDFPETLEYIGGSAFSRVPGINHLILHGKLGIVNSSSFSNCNNLEYVWLQEGITVVDQFAFSNCEKLTYIVLPSTIQSVKACAFGDSRINHLDYEGHVPRNFFLLSETPFAIEYRKTTDGGSVHPSLGLIVDGDRFYVKESAVNAYKEKWRGYQKASSYVNCHIPFNSEISYSTNCREFDTDYHVTAENGNKPFIATSFTGEQAIFTSIDDGIVPAGTAVLIRKKSEDNIWYQIAEQQGAQFNTPNYLKGVTYADEISPNTEDGFINYVLSNGEFCRFDNVGVLGDHKAYLQLPTSMAAKFSLVFDDKVTNGISEIVSKEIESDIYSLNGLRVVTPTKGIYIKGGKKFVIK